MSKKPVEFNAYGTWNVTTEGDVEGRTTRQLGTHTGFIDDIAFKLADQAYYGLRFDPVDPTKIEKTPRTRTRVQVSLDIGSGTWDMDGPARVAYFKKMLAGRDTLVGLGQYYACVELIDGKTPEAQERARRAAVAAGALAKLSKDEIDALREELK
jgi:hypothetical protein